MKYFFTLILLSYSINSFAQKEYYSTNEKNRLTKAELETILLQQQEKLGDKLKGMTLVANTTKTETKQDSIIHYVAFGVKGAKSFNSNFSDYLNKSFPEFKLTDLKGNEITLEDLKGKPTLINFWFTSCAPCIAEMPILNKIQEKYNSDFNFVSLTYEAQQNVEKFLEKRDFNFKHLVDAKDFINKMGINTYPLNFFLDKNGIVKEVKYGIPKMRDKDGKIKMGDGDKFIEILENLK